ncbi:MAG: GHKL domain-containing protein [Proteobacteria bacterium]|nr:MAG: GHKL domain-containing protein [Pseudomonadota bacterium]
MSDMMRYTTYESSNERVFLSQEVEYLQNFIELQMLRLSNKELVDFKISGDIERTLIAPTLLIPFVENAFKHASDKKFANGIRICLTVDYGILYFTCSNKYDDENSFSKDKKGGIGLANIERRLQLLYPNSHHLEIQKSDGTYTATLKINLNEPVLHNN